jgi:ATP-dependent Clp protease ATP-binding subunit ClpA
MPVAFLVMALIAIAQFCFEHAPSLARFEQWGRCFTDFLRTNGWYVLGSAGLLWLITIIGIIHERKYQTADRQTERGWMMDILDRLTNKQILEQKLASETDSEFINAAQLAERLKTKVIGQDAVCDDLAAQIRRRLALQQRNKPIGIFMMAGPPGTGKTYLAKCLAAELQRKLLHLDMTQFSRGGLAATQLFGSSKGYVGSDTYGKLTATLRDIPDSVILLDEFEKAHQEVHKNFLTAWNDGFVTEASDGRQISTTKSIFIMTTNAAVDTLRELVQRFSQDPDELRRASINALREAGFAPEVLNRLDRIFVFKPLEGLDIARVTALEIEAMIQGYGLNVSDGGIDPELLLGMMRRHDRLGVGASSRDLVRSVEESIADTLIEAKQKGYVRISLIFKNGIVTALPSA